MPEVLVEHQPEILIMAMLQKKYLILKYHRLKNANAKHVTKQQIVLGILLTRIQATGVGHLGKIVIASKNRQCVGCSSGTIGGYKMKHIYYFALIIIILTTNISVAQNLVENKPMKYPYYASKERIMKKLKIIIKK